MNVKYWKAHSAPVHMLLAVPPKYAGAQVLGVMKDKSAFLIARDVEIEYVDL